MQVRRWIRLVLFLMLMLLGWGGVAYAKTAQTITFNSLPSRTYGVAPFTVSATGGASGNAVTFTSATTSVCTATGTNGATITVVAVGTCTINVNQAGNNTYAAATQVSQSFTVSQGTQTITFAALPGRTVAARPFTVSATSSAGLTVTFSSSTTSICTVSGSTVTVVSLGTCTINAAQAGNSNVSAASTVPQSFTVRAFCAPPSNIPAGISVTCNCDTFNRASINPSAGMFNSNWTLSHSDSTGLNPYINQTTGLLRLTENTGDNAKAASAPGIYPAAGNYISVEFNHYAYNSTSNPGADGLAVTLSDSSVPANPGGFGGSQGYAPEGTPGFAGGWLGVALDEYGNYSNPTEGRTGGTGFFPEEIGMRGPGSGTSGYNWISGTGSNPGGLSIDNFSSTSPTPGYMYQVVVDARNESSGVVNVGVNRDSSTLDGSNYNAVLAPVNVYSQAANAVTQGWISQVVPNYWQISFTSSTGGNNNVHEIGDLRICAQTVYPPTGQTASGFSAIDSGYPVTAPATAPTYQYFQTGDIFMKLTGVPFKLWVAALTSNGISTGYSATTLKYVQVNLVPNLGSACSPSVCNSTCTGQAAVESGGSQIVSYTPVTPGAALSPNFTLNSAYQNLVAVMKECTSATCTSYTSTAPACSADSFSVRPLSVSITSSAGNSATSGTPALRAGTDSFTVNATTAGVTGASSNYNGVLTSHNASIQTVSPSTYLGVVSTTSAFPAATIGTPSSTAAASFTYSEVGTIALQGQNSATTPFVDDETWTSVDSASTKNDCNVGLNAYSNTMDSNGKYGCYFGTLSNTTVGRFIPDHFDTIVTPSIPCPTSVPSGQTCTPSNGFTYSGQAFTTQVVAKNAADVTTQNYDSGTGYSKAVTLSAWDAATGLITNPGGTTVNGGVLTNTSVAASAFTAGAATLPTPVYTFVTQKTAPTTIRIRAVDTDNVTSLRTSPAVSIEGQTLIQSGQTRIINAYGSPLVPLPVTVWLQYWNGSNWVFSTMDQTTSFNSAISPNGNVAANTISPSTISAVTYSSAITSFKNFNGIANFILQAPKASGSVNLNLNIPSYFSNLIGRVTFGVYAGSPAVIYLREIY